MTKLANELIIGKTAKIVLILEWFIRAGPLDLAQHLVPGGWNVMIVVRPSTTSAYI
jgi:hypothetical protein